MLVKLENDYNNRQSKLTLRQIANVLDETKSIIKNKNLPIENLSLHSGAVHKIINSKADKFYLRDIDLKANIITNPDTDISTVQGVLNYYKQILSKSVNYMKEIYEGLDQSIGTNHIFKEPSPRKRWGAYSLIFSRYVTKLVPVDLSLYFNPYLRKSNGFLTTDSWEIPLKGDSYSLLKRLTKMTPVEAIRSGLLKVPHAENFDNEFVHLRTDKDMLMQVPPIKLIGRIGLEASKSSKLILPEDYNWLEKNLKPQFENQTISEQDIGSTLSMIVRLCNAPH